MANGFFMVWNTKRNLPAVRHPSRNAAKAEAERLARLQPGDEFFVLKAVSRSAMPKVNPITTKVTFDPAVAGPKKFPVPTPGTRPLWICEWSFMDEW